MDHHHTTTLARSQHPRLTNRFIRAVSGDTTLGPEVRHQGFSRDAEPSEYQHFTWGR